MWLGGVNYVPGARTPSFRRYVRADEEEKEEKMLIVKKMLPVLLDAKVFSRETNGIRRRSHRNHHSLP